MEIKKIANSHFGQDGAIWKNLFFRFVADGSCVVQDLNGLTADPEATLPVVSRFTLDRAEDIVPHANAVVFGPDYYADGDEFPLVYNNIYNNYAKADDQMRGTLCVYRIQRMGDGFTSTLVQIIRLGFTDDPLWVSENGQDIRPYGNLVIDRDARKLLAFTMRDGDQTTRFFTLPLPAVTEGEPDPKLGIKTVTLGKESVEESFDIPYSNYLQGACMEKGLIYSVEGFDFAETAPAAIRVIDPKAKAQIHHVSFAELGYGIEPECIDFFGDRLLYSDAKGNLFELNF